MGKLQRLQQPIDVLLQRHPVQVFVETGTFHGESLEHALTLPFKIWHSVELAPDLHRRASERFDGHPGLTLHHGDSAIVLPQILAELRGPAFFWLDAHFCFLDSARGPKDCPLLDEIAAIAEHERATGAEHLIAVDDYHILGTSPDSPWLVSEEVVFVPEADWSDVTPDVIKQLLGGDTKTFQIWGDTLFAIPTGLDTSDVIAPPDPYARARTDGEEIHQRDHRPVRSEETVASTMSGQHGGM